MGLIRWLFSLWKEEKSGGEVGPLGAITGAPESNVEHITGPKRDPPTSLPPSPTHTPPSHTTIQVVTETLKNADFPSLQADHKTHTSQNVSKLSSAGDYTADNTAPKTQDVVGTTPTAIQPTGEGKIRDSLLLEWEGFIQDMHDTEWKPVEQDSFYDDAFELVSSIKEEFGLHLLERARVLQHCRSNSTICLCEEGVFLFSIQFEDYFTISKSISGALKYFRTPGTKAAGPVRGPKT